MLNNVNIQGRLTANPELRHTQNGTAVTSFTLAVDRNFKSEGERQADFISCVAWRGTAEFIARNFSKGKMMIANGNLQTRTYTASDGSKRYVTEVLAESVYFAGDKEKTHTDENNGFRTNEFTEIEDDGDLPF